MKNRIIKYLENGTYKKNENFPNLDAYTNKNGWTSFYLDDNVAFSYRKNEYLVDAFSERLHHHDYFELAIIFSGDGAEYIADNQRIPLSNGLVILTKPNKFHMVRLYKKTKYERFIIYFKNSKELFPDSEIMDFINYGNDSSAFFNLSKKQCNDFLYSIENAIIKEKSYKKSKAYITLYNLFLTLSDSENQKETTTAVPHFINEIKEYVDNNFTKIRSVNELSNQFFYSREYISRSFKEYYNTPLYDYILARKTSLCASLLLKGETVDNSSKNAGFINVSSFIKVFKKFYGVTPSEYKKKGYKNS